MIMGGLRLYRNEVQILVIEAEIGAGRHGPHLQALDGACEIEIEGNIGVFDVAIGPMSAERVVLYVFERAFHSRRVIKPHAQTPARRTDARRPIPRIPVHPHVGSDGERATPIGAGGLLGLRCWSPAADSVRHARHPPASGWSWA